MHPGPWMHHLELFDEDEVDEDVIGWLSVAANDAGPRFARD